MLKRFIISGMLYVMSVSPAASQHTASGLLLTNATIIDGDPSVAPYKGSVFIENGCIVRIATGEKKIKRHTQRVIDCGGKYLCPGLIDAHVHLATGNLTDSATYIAATDSILVNMVKHGITTVRDMAGNALWLRRFASLAKANTKSYPDIFYAAQFAGPPYFNLLNRGRSTKEGAYPWSRTITDTTDIVKAVSDARSVGVSGIKIYASLSAGLMQRITEEAHRQGIQAWSHAAVNPVLPLETANVAVNSMSHANDLVFQQFPASDDIGIVWKALHKGIKGRQRKYLSCAGCHEKKRRGARRHTVSGYQ